MNEEQKLFSPAVSFFPILLWLTLSAAAYGQVLQDSADLRASETGAIAVRVRSATGAPLNSSVVIRLSSRGGGFTLTSVAQGVAPVEFAGLPVGDYVVEARTPGFLPAKEEAQLAFAGSTIQVFVHLRAESEPNLGTTRPGPPPMSRKARKEIQKASQALEKNDGSAALQHLKNAEKAAPNHAEVQYRLGLLYLRRGNSDTARVHLEKAVALAPKDAAALTALGGLLLQQGAVELGIQVIERALAVDGRSPENHATLADSFLQRGELQKAAFHAQQAVDLTAGKRPEMRLLLNRVYRAQGENEKAREALEAFLRDFPNHAYAPEVRKAMAALNRETSSAANIPVASDAGNRDARTGAGISPLRDALALEQPVKPAPAPAEDLLREEWAPADIDNRPPAVFRDVPCSVEDVIQQVGHQVERLARDLGNVNAEEAVEHVEFDRHGKPRLPEIRHYDYMVSIRRIRNNSLAVEEFRNGSHGAEALMGLATTGLAAMALVFHPLYVDDFARTCEGQGVWNGQPVWYLYFKQRADKPARIRRYTDSRGSQLIPLKGRAWIHANSYQILRLETDLVAPMPAAQLEREHMVIEYSPVSFEKRKETFWLPASADVYAHLRGRRWHRRHQLQNYIHFAVDTRQKIAAPTIPDDEPPQPPTEKPPQNP